MTIPAIPAQTHHWLAQQRVHPNVDLSAVLPTELEALGARRVMLLSTPALRDSRVLARARDAIGARLAATFDGIEAHTPAPQVAWAAAVAVEAGVDHVVAVGGGSVIDAGKALCYATWERLTTPEALLQSLPRGWQPSQWDDTTRRPRLVAVPTTLSAAEFSSHAGITDSARGRKHVVLHPLMVPQVVLLDPSATLETPQPLLLSSAVRSVDHAVERWCSVAPSPFSDAVSRQAMQMLAEVLPQLRKRPDDLAARAAAQYAAWLSVMGGWAGTPVGASHGLGYILGAYKGVPHGLTSCLMLHAVLQWNALHPQPRQQLVAATFGGARDAWSGIEAFVSSLDLPTRLSSVGIGTDQFADIATQYDGRGPIATNPRPICGVGDLVEILELAR